MRQKKLLSMVLVLMMILSMFTTMQIAWADDAPPPTISADKTVLYAGEEDGQTVVLTLENDTFANPGVYINVAVNGSFASPSGAYNSIYNTRYTVTINKELKAGDEVSIFFYKQALTGGTQDTNTVQLTVEAARPLAINSDALERADQYVYYNHYFTSIGGIGKRTYTCTDGALPSGLTLFSGGQLSGNPDIVGNYDFEITVTDSAYSANTSTGSYTLVVDALSDYEFSNNTITGYTGAGGDITIPSEIHGEKITAIGERAFDSNNSITSVAIPDGITSIGNYAFLGCANLSSVAIPDSVISIGRNAFSMCSALESAVLPDNITTIPDYAFYNCYGLESVIIPAGVESIGNNAFYYCTALKNVKLPASLKSIGNAAFYNCKSFKDIVIPSGVTSIGSSTFQFESGSQMTSAVFLGAAPFVGDQGFVNPAEGFKIYYPVGEPGYTNPWYGFPTESYDASGTYKVAYDANGGTGDVPSEATGLKVGDYVEVEGQGKLARANGTFTGWNTAADGSGVNYSTGDELLLCNGAVTLYAQWDMLYSITVDGTIANGSISTEATAAEGDMVEVTVTPASGYQLKEGSLVYNDGTRNHIIEGGLDKKVKAEAPGAMLIPPKPPMPPKGGYSFEMPAANVTITAQFERIYTVTFDLAGGTQTGGGALTQNVAQGSAAIAPTATRSGYTFNGWDKDFSNVTASMTVTARWTQNTGSISNPSDDSDHGSSSGGSAPSTVTPPATTSAPPVTTTETTATGNTTPSVTSITTTEAKSDSNGKATAAVTESQVTDAVNKAVEAAAKQGTGTEAKVEIRVTAPTDAKTVEASLPKTAITEVAGSKISALTVSTPVATITFDKEAVNTISKEAAADVKIAASKIDAAGLSEETKAAVGDRPVYNFSVTSGNKTISQFGGNVSVSVPYTPKAGEDTNAIVIYYINAEGKPEVVSNCKYNPATGSITFNTNHFSMYAVGYNKVTFKDVAIDAWYSKAVGFIAARDITAGTGRGNFGPEAKLTRGEFLVMLMRAYGIASDANPKDNFSDAGNTYYTGYLAAAKRLGISGGAGNNLFAPDKEITRQEMFTLLYKVLKAKGEIPKGKNGKALSDFKDEGQTASWAKDAMELFVQTGIISGIEGKLTPTDTTTRAEMAQVLYNLLSK